MKHEELVNMTAKDLRARLKEINQQATDATGDTLDTLITEAEDINGILQDVQNRKKLAGFAAAAGTEEPKDDGEGDEVRIKQERTGEKN